MKKHITICINVIVILFSLTSYSQKSDFVIMSTNDTVYINKFNILNKKVKLIVDGNSKKYAYDEIIAIFDSDKNKYLEKITPAFVEYKGPSGTTFFAERLTKGKVRIYKYFTNQYLPMFSKGIGSNFGNNGFYSYYICIEGSKPELLCYNEIELSKGEYEIVKLYLHSNNKIQDELEKLFFSDKKEKEKDLIELVNNYNKWNASEK